MRPDVIVVVAPKSQFASGIGQATFDWQAARDAALGRMCTITLINAVEEY